MSDPTSATAAAAGAASPGPDRPPLPQLGRFGVVAKLLTGVLAIVVVGYVWSAATGYTGTTEHRAAVPSSVRSSPGGYRSYHFWHGGYSGGK